VLQLLLIISAIGEDEENEGKQELRKWSQHKTMFDWPLSLEGQNKGWVLTRVKRLKISWCAVSRNKKLYK
jgi:hypothetical protein